MPEGKKEKRLKVQMLLPVPGGKHPVHPACRRLTPARLVSQHHFLVKPVRRASRNAQSTAVGVSVSQSKAAQPQTALEPHGAHLILQPHGDTALSSALSTSL